MLMGNPHPIFAADFPFGCVEEVRHHSALAERLLVFVERFYIDETNSTVSERMVIVIAVRFLNDHFILEPRHIGRNSEDGSFITQGNAGCGSDYQRPGGARSDESGFATQSLRQICS